MRCLPDVVWLTVVAIAACGSGYPTRMQLRDIVKQILFEDVLFQDVLSERIKLDATDLPPSVRGSMGNIADLDPLVALHELSKRTEYYSGQQLVASTKVLSTALKCLTYKRLAVHVALTNRMLVLQTEQNANRIRLRVFTNLIPRDVDMLMTVQDNKYMELLGLFDKIHGILSQSDDDIAKQENRDSINEELTTISQTIESSCTLQDMPSYFKQLNIATPGDLEQYPDIISGDKVSDTVPLKNIDAMLRENENAIIDLFELLYLLRTMSLSTWKDLLKHADMPIGEDFVRRSVPSYRDEIRKILSSRFQATADVVAKKHDILHEGIHVPVE